MKKKFLILFAVVYSKLLFTQAALVNKPALLDAIKKATKIADYCNSPCNCARVPPLLFLQQDSLLKHSSLEETIGYFKEPSYVLKAYSYLKIVYENDTLALQLLEQSIADTTMIYYAGWNLDKEPFNSYLVACYLDLLKIKYYYGGNVTSSIRNIKRFSYNFPKADKNLYKQKLIYIHSFLKKHAFFKEQANS